MVLLPGAGVTEALCVHERRVRPALVRQLLVPEDVLGDCQVALCMAGLKLVRASVNPDDPDSFDDGHGYLTIGEEIYGHKENTRAEAGS